MKKAIMISIFLYAVSFSFEGPDLMLLGPDYNSGINSFSDSNVDSSSTKITASAAHAFLYGINSLDWTYAASKISLKGWSSAIAFRSYGIRDLYMSSRYSLYVGISLKRYFSAGLGYSHQAITYGDNLHKSTDDYFSCRFGFEYSDWRLQAEIDNLKFKSTAVSYKNNPEIIISGNWQAEKTLSIYALYYKDSRDHSRLTIGQNLQLHRSANLLAGIISGPELYFAGIEIVYKRIVIGYTYFDVSGLADCSKLTLTYR